MAFLRPRTCTARDGREFVIRTAQCADATALLAYIRPVAEQTEFFILEPDEFPETDEQERQWVQDHLDSPGKILLLAEASGKILGNVSFENGSHRRIAHRGTLGIAVVHDWRGQGVGTALLSTLLDWAAGNPLIDKVCLEVFATNQTAIRLYKKMGFVEEGRRPNDIKLGPGRYVDTVAMYRFVLTSALPGPPFPRRYNCRIGGSRGRAMGGRRATARKPATKFAHLRKKMAKGKVQQIGKAKQASRYAGR